VSDNGRIERDLRLSIESSGRFIERGGDQVVTGTITLVGLPLSQPLPIMLVSSDSRRIAIPSGVVLPAGRTSVTFPVHVLDNLMREAPARVFVTARAASYGTAFFEVIITDNDGPSLSLSPSSTWMRESIGSFTATITRRNVPITATTPALTVSLASSNPAVVVLPASVVIPRGSASVTFTVRIVNNTLVDGTRRVNSLLRRRA
jgi:hypothetical protein